MAVPTCFISYAWESEDLKDWVRHLATHLQESGVWIHLDQWDISPGSDLTGYMERSVRESDFVILVCTPTFAQKADAGAGGVGYEKRIVTGEIFQNVGNPNKFIPVLRNGASNQALPGYLKSTAFVDFRDDHQFDRSLEELLRLFHSAPRYTRPPLGSPPVFKERKDETRRDLEAGSHTPKSGVVFDEEWRSRHREAAMYEVRKANVKFVMEVTASITPPVKKQPGNLLQAASSAMIHTFGWPIAIMDLSAEIMRPKPTNEGIINLVRRDEDRGLFDYWTLRRDGAFFLLKTLFEELRESKNLFFDTRIVRTTEIVLYLSRLYRGLGSHENDWIRLDIGYTGLEGSKLAATSDRPLWHTRGPAVVNECVTSIEVRLKEFDDNTVDCTQELTAPLFNLFDFTEVDRSIYEQIVQRFKNGQV